MEHPQQTPLPAPDGQSGTPGVVAENPATLAAEKGLPADRQPKECKAARSSMAPYPGLVAHAVLAGLTPLIPVPFLDDVVHGYLMRTMVLNLARQKGRTIAREEVAALSAVPSSGCLGGCAAGFGQLLLYPVRKVFRKVFFFLEWKRAADTISYTYYHGYLVQCVLAMHALDRHTPDEVATAIQRVLGRVNTSVINRLAYESVRQSPGLLRRVKALWRKELGLPRSSPSDDQLGGIAARASKVMQDLTDRLTSAVSQVPQAHFDGIRSQLETEMAQLRHEPA